MKAPLLAVPNVSAGRDQALVKELAVTFDARLLDVHSDPDHNRSVFTLAGHPGSLASAVASGARAALARIDIREHEGVHPRVGAIDVAPIVYLQEAQRGAACAEALVLGDLLGTELELPVFLYGELAGGRPRAELRRGGTKALQASLQTDELNPDFGPPKLHPTGGAVLVAARPPLIAFNVELEPPASAQDAKTIAARIREGGAEGQPGVRAIGLWLEGRRAAQVSMNIEDHEAAPLPEILRRISRYATPARAELVGLAPQAALEGFPGDVALSGRATIEDALARGAADKLL